MITSYVKKIVKFTITNTWKLWRESKEVHDKNDNKKTPNHILFNISSEYKTCVYRLPSSEWCNIIWFFEIEDI